MNVLSYLTPERTQAGASVSSKKRAFELISQLIANNCENLSEQQVFDSLFTRERLGCTGLGNGVALPHGRCADCQKITGALIMLETPVDYDSQDRQPVDIFFAMMVPEECHDEHLTYLSNIAELLKKEGFCRQLRNAHSDQALYDIVASYVDKGSTTH